MTIDHLFWPIMSAHDLPALPNVTDAEMDLLRGAYNVWKQKRPRNLIRTSYFESKMPFKDFGISTPPEVRARIRAVLGWPRLACTSLAERSLFDGFVHPSGSDDPMGLGEVLHANRFEEELPEAILSAYKHSCSFFTVTKGDVASGQPDIVLAARDAEWTGGLWDRRRRTLAALLAITDVELGSVTGFDVYLPDVVLVARREGYKWSVERRPSRLGEVSAEPVVWEPELGRPLGRSRISRPVMSITDNALRTIVRTEVSAEIYAAPRMAAIGLAESFSGDDKWHWVLNRFLEITKDEDGDKPEVKQFPQMTMEPLMALYRSYASQMQAETGIPISSLGIVQDNPTSAEAMYAAREDLINAARRANRRHTSTLLRLADKIVRSRAHSQADIAEAAKLDATWVNPAFTSPVTAAGALVQLKNVFPWLEESEVALEFAGFSRAEITRMQAEKRRAGSGGLLDRVLARDTAPVVEPAPEP